MNLQKENSATKAKRKYNQKAYDRLYITVPKGVKEKLKNLLGESINSYVISALKEKYKTDTGKDLIVNTNKSEEEK